MERVLGPVNGFYIAVYTARSGSGRGYSSYAKVCAKPPASYWEADCIFKLFGGENHSSPQTALGYANLAARAQIARIPPLVELPNLGFAMLNDARQVIFPLAGQIRQRMA